MELAGVKVDHFCPGQACEEVLRTSSRHPVKVFFANAHCVNVAQKDPGYLRAMSEADFVLNDGVGVALAGRVLRAPFEANLNGTDWIPQFLDGLDESQSRLQRVFLLGAEDGVLHKAERVFRCRWPGLEVVGSHHGFFLDSDEVLLEIREARPDVLLVAMGVPKQELFLQQHWEELKEAGLKVGIAGGAILDFLTHKVPRAPKWMRQARLEWLYRLWVEPGRMWRRYLIGNLQFLFLVFREWWRSFRRQRELENR